VHRSTPVADRPFLPAGPIPEETAARSLLIRSTAVVALAITVVYLVWRLNGTIAPEIWWLSVPLFVVEVHNAVGLALYTFALWDVGRRPRWRRVTETDHRVAILIPTVNEPAEVLLPTIAAAVVLRPAHETWVLDDGGREDVRALAESLGARYLARQDRTHAKAGNLNHALGVIEADVIAVLDADHVPTRDFLANTLGYFDDPEVAIVQTPQSFYNVESFEHERRGDGHFNEESVFYRVIAPAKNRWSAPFWCGTSALVRTAAIRSIGGVATESVTEDIHSTIRMYRNGWKGVFHNEVLAHGLAPGDAAAYLGQRNRWATGAMQVLRLENPLFRRGLSFGQRVAFMTTLFAWFDSWRMLAYMVIPVAVIITGASPIAAPGHVFVPLFALTLGIQFIALRLLARGHYPPILSMLFEVLRMPAVLPATLTLLKPDVSQPFRVTPKGRTDDRLVSAVPTILTLLAAASTAALAWFVLTAFGLTPTDYAEPGAAIGAGFFVAVNLSLLLAAVGRIRAARFAGDRRASVRFDVRLAGKLGRRRCTVLDVSLTGARVIVRAPQAQPKGPSTFRVEVDGQALTFRSRMRRIQRLPDGSTMVGLEFADGQQAEVRRLALALFGADNASWQQVAEPLRAPQRRAMPTAAASSASSGA
jgi:cellulose synthase (UDP-forming)